MWPKLAVWEVERAGLGKDIGADSEDLEYLAWQFGSREVTWPDLIPAASLRVA